MVKAQLRGGLIFILLVVFVSSANALTNIDNCTSLNISGETYILTQNILHDRLGTCITISEDNIVFDMNGYSIIGTNNGDQAISFIENRSNNAVINGSIVSFDVGILVAGTENKVEDLNITNNGAGIIVSRANYSLIKRNSFYLNDYAIFLQDGDYNECADPGCAHVNGYNFESVIENNTFDKNNYSIRVSGAVDEFKVLNNIIENSTMFGINIFGTGNRSYTNSQIYRNILINNVHGIIISDYLDYINIGDNYISNGEHGLTVINGNVNRFVGEIQNVSRGITISNSSISIINSNINSSLYDLVIGPNEYEIEGALIYNTTIDKNKIARVNNSVIWFAEWKLFRIVDTNGSLVYNTSSYFNQEYMQEIMNYMDPSFSENLNSTFVSNEPIFDLLLPKEVWLYDRIFNFSDLEFEIYVVENNSKETTFNFNFSSGENNTIIFVLVNDSSQESNSHYKPRSTGSANSDSASISMNDDYFAEKISASPTSTQMIEMKSYENTENSNNHLTLILFSIIFFIALLALIKLVI